LDEVLISHIIFNVKPQSYQTLMTIMKRELNLSPNLMDLETVKKDISQLYTLSKRQKVGNTRNWCSTHKKRRRKLSRRFSKEIVKFVAGKDIKQQIVGNLTATKRRDLPIISQKIEARIPSRI
jgi:hypothetical protein